MPKRLLPTTKDFGLMHIVIKTTGKGHNSDQWIFNNQQKCELYQQLKRFLDLFEPIQLIGFNIMSNHAHVLLNIPDDYQISRSEVSEKYHQCYPNRKIHPNSHACHKLKNELNNISAFMQRFSRDFAYRFNHSRKFKRTGHLWGERFHNTNLGDDAALLRCWVYIIFNPVKADMVKNPLDYKFSSMNCENKEIMDEAMHNFYELYKMLSGKESLTMDEFRTMLIELLQAELDAWNRKNEAEKTEYRDANRMWDRAHYIDKNILDTI